MTNTSKDFLLRALLATLEGLTHEQFTELERIRSDSEQVARQSAEAAEQAECGLSCDRDGRIVRR